MRYVFMTSKPETDMVVPGVIGWQRIYGAHTISTAATPVYRNVTIPCSGTFKNFVFRLSVAPGAGKTFTFYLYVNNAATAMSFTISGASQTTGMNLTHKVHVKPGDLVAIGFTATGGSTLGRGYSTIDFISDKPNEWPIVGGYSGNYLYNAGSCWGPVMGGNSALAAAADAGYKAMTVTYCPISGRITNFYFTLDVAPGVGKSRDITLYQNGAATGMTINIAGAATSGSTTSNAFHVAQGDTIQWYQTATGTPGASYCNWGMTFISDVPNSWFISACYDDLNDNTGTTEYNKLFLGSTDAWTATEASTIMYSPISPVRPFIMKKMYVSVTAALGANSNTYIVRQNSGSPTNGLSATITHPATTSSDLTNQILIDSNKSLDMMVTNTSPTTARYSQISIGCFTTPEENQNLYKPTLHADPGIGLKRHPRSRIY